MSFEYGSKQIQVRNPFIFQGRLMLASGILLLLLGIVLFFVISGRSSAIAAGAGRGALFYLFFAGIILTSAGVAMTVKGLFMVNKFYVGRGMPADLASEITRRQGEYAKNPNSVYYDADQLHKALINRTNPSFVEPHGLLPRLLHTYNPELLYLPLQIRNITQSAFEIAVYQAGILVFFGLSVLSGVIGVNDFTTTPIWKYIGWVYVYLMVFVCITKSPKKNIKLLRMETNTHFVFSIAVAILIPLIAGLFDKVSDVSASPVPLLMGFPVLSAGSFAFIYFLSIKRLPEKEPSTEVSEFREQWEESVNPQEIFRNVDMSLADFRHLDISNRKYRDADTGLISYEKGEYSGSMIQETQPVPLEEINNSSLTDRYKKICACAAQVLITAAGIWLFILAGFIDPAATTTFQVFSSIIGIFLFYYFGHALYKAAYTFFGEVRFKSHLIHFFADGTFNKSKISTGMSVYDSMRSENELVRSSIRPWIVCAEIETTTFAVSGHYNLEQYRLILEMNKDDKWLEKIVANLKKYLRERRKIADTVSTGDLESTARMAQINRIIRTGYDKDDGDSKKLDHQIAEIMSDEVKKDH